MKQVHQYIIGGACLLLVIAGTAVGSTYLTQSAMEPQAAAPVAQPVHVAQQPRPQQVASAQPQYRQPIRQR